MIKVKYTFVVEKPIDQVFSFIRLHYCSYLRMVELQWMVYEEIQPLYLIQMVYNQTYLKFYILVSDLRYFLIVFPLIFVSYIQLVFNKLVYTF